MFLIASRLDLRQKDLKTALRALALVAAKHPEVILLFAGEGSGLTTLQSMTAELELGAHVQFLGFRDDVPDLMAAADTVLFPTFYESFGIVAVEAMAVGVPLIATDVPGLREVCEFGAAGLLVEKEDPQDMSRAMVRLMEDPGLGDSLRESGARRLNEEYSVDGMIRRYFGLYRALARAQGNVGAENPA